MPNKTTKKNLLPSPFTIIDDGKMRGVIAPVNKLSSERLAFLLEDLEDTDEKFLHEVHSEYEQSKKQNSFFSSVGSMRLAWTLCFLTTL